MEIKYPLWLYVLQLLHPIFCIDQFFIAPQSSCGNTCSGSLIDPFSNIFDALQKGNDQQSAQIILLSGPITSDHFAISKESLGSFSPQSSSIIEYTFRDLEIKPLYCNDDLLQSNPVLNDKCFPVGSKPIIYLKTTMFKITITGSLLIKDVIIDGIEDIAHSNNNSSALIDCISTDKRCCEQDHMYSSIYPSLLCFNQSSAPQLTQIQNHSLFVLNPENNVDRRIDLAWENLELRNFFSPHLESLIKIGPDVSFSSVYNQILIDRVYFNRGLITQATDTGSSKSPKKDNSSILFQNAYFTNYNNWNIKSQDKSRREGYLFYSLDTFSGTLTLTASQFINFTSSVRSKCWPQTADYYHLPMNNLLSSDPRSRSDLWSQYHQEIHTKPDYGSSLISIGKLNGSISIIDSTFRNIIGTSGSVLRVDDISPIEQKQFIIHNSIFDSNFAYDSFANIMIAKTSDPYFSSILDCPRIQIENSTFNKNYGCPGAYGNILFLCYWDTQPQKSSLTSYSLSTKTSDLITAWQKQSEEAAYITIKSCIFENNLLAVSNSLAIIGGYFVFLKGNLFQNNGGTTAEIAKFSLQGSYFKQRYPEAITFSSPLSHFGQSSTVYIDRITKIYFKANIFRANWGPWEGSLSLGCSVTIKNWIQTLNGIKFENDSFENHQGIPSQIAASLTDTSLKYNVYMDPIVTISVDVTGSSQIAPLLGLIGPVNILFQRVNFRNNVLNYNYRSYAYNLEELRTLFVEVLPLNVHFQSGMVKLLWVSEAIDDISYGFKGDIATPTRTTLAFEGGEIVANELQSKGCFFSSVSFFSRLHILDNQIYTNKPALEDRIDFNIFYFFSSGTPKYGLLCQGTSDFIGPTSRLQINDLFVRNNKGIIINLFADTRATALLVNSIFENNTATSFGMISVLFGAEFTYINNIFTNNDNFAGSIFMEIAESPVGLFNSYLKNTGVYSSAITCEYSSLGFEGLSKVYWNTLKVFDGYGETLIPVFGIYALNYVTFQIFGSHFTDNRAYSGVINAMATIKLNSCNFTDHYVIGSSVLGILPSVSTLIMEDIFLYNNTIIKDPLMPKSQSGILVAYTSNIFASNIRIEKGSAKDGSMLIFANNIIGSMSNITIKEFYREESGQAPLINLDFSTFDIKNLSCSNTTGLFKFSGSTVTLSSIVISSMTQLLENQFLFHLSNTNLKVEDMKYTGNGKYNNYLPLIGGDKNYITIVRTVFEDATGGKNKIFSLKSSENFLIADSSFKYSQSLVNVTVFDLVSSKNVMITKCFFGLSGRVLQVIYIEENFYFVGNVLLTSSHVDNLVLDYIGTGFILQNNFIRQGHEYYASLPNSQISLRDSRLAVLLKDNRFISLYGLNGIVEVKAEYFPYNLNFINELFLNNIGSNGGSIQLNAQKGWSNIISPEALIQNSDFIKNRAINCEKLEGKGGALYITTSDKTDQVITLKEDKFIGNDASTLGGAIFFDYSPPIVSSDTKFIRNTAQVPNHIGAYPVQLILLNEESTLTTDYIPGTIMPQLYQRTQIARWDKLVSGMETDRIYRFALIDMFNQLVYSDNTSKLEIYPDGFEENMRAQFSNKLSTQALKGLYTLEKFKFTYKTDQKLNVTFKTNAITNYSSLPVDSLIVLPSVTVEVSFRTCGAGEYMAFKTNLAYCVECPVGYWQVDAFEPALNCEPCDTDSTICRGANKIGVKQGYWRMNETATLVLECPRPESCLGSDINGDTITPVGKCAYGYQGNLCNDCIEGWAKNSQEECIDCETNLLTYFILAGLFLFKGALIGFGVKETLEIEKEHAAGDSNEISTAALFRIFISYCQIFSLIISVPIVWPGILTRVFKIAGFLGAATENFFTIDCVYIMMKQVLKTETIFLKALFETLNPFVFIIFGIVFWLGYTKFKRQPILRNQDLLDKLMVTIVITCFDMQPDVIKSSFYLLQCTNLYSKKKSVEFLVDAYDIKCWESPHINWVFGLVFPSLLLWVVVLPGFVFYILTKNKNNLDSIQVARKYSFIYDGYRKDKYYWEIIITIRKVILVSNAAFAVLNSAGLEVIFFFVLIFISYILNAVFQPYASKELNNLEKISILSLGTVNLCGLYFASVESNNILDIAVIIVGIVGNLYFILTFGKLFGTIQLHKIQKIPWLMQLMKKIKAKCPCFFRNNQLPKIIARAKPAPKLSPKEKEIGFEPSNIRELIRAETSCIIEEIESVGIQNDKEASPSLRLNSLRPTQRTESNPSSSRGFLGIKGVITPSKFDIKRTQISKERVAPNIE